MRDKSEIKISKRLGGKLTNASGAVNNDADIRFKGYLIECKRRDTETSIVLYRKIWNKLRKQAVRTNKLPIYIFERKMDRYVFTYTDILDDLFNKTRPTRYEFGYESPGQDKNIRINFEDFWRSYSDSHSRGVICTYQFREIPCISLIEYKDFEYLVKEDT